MASRLLISLGLAFVALPGVAQAQMISPMLYEGPRIALQDHADRFSNDARAPQAHARIAADPGMHRYAPSKARRMANLARFVSKTRAADPRGADDLQKLFAQGDFIEKIGALVAPQGLRIDNIADAYALWWITAWEAAHGDNDTPNRATLAAVRRQAASAIGATGEIAGASDAQKQELAEALWVQSALLDGAVEQAKQNPERMRAIGDAARKGAAQMGLDLDSFALTAHGFVPARVGHNQKRSGPAPMGYAGSYGALALAAGGVGMGGLLMIRQRRG
ncbi:MULTISPECIES: DUF6683 family protein [Sphingomonas]|uniref:Secreted protein n=1 Tax=Sphingomonas trueperi TaxID=53317 RepID=A0A7X6BDS8_9SPHN|nr:MULTISPECIES: DUF6683 family protein [Sphingomonas]NJB99454.1 hypothetical protein [Sphingomonas trueperi]